MPRIKASFKNQDGEKLAALLETPEGEARAYAIFAHCFTCSKDIAAASRITRGLASQGIAVLRFDFTGLGNSDGDFANTNFSSNLQDLLSAAAWLEENYSAPGMVVGHSLGGAAVLAAAHSLTTVRAIVTIGAPATADHVEHLFAGSKEKILEQAEATVDLAGRQFTIKRQFLEDINRYNDVEHIGKLERALLVFHSPVDNTVSIDEAAKIYTAAKHPKSFISLDRADHLLSRREDSEYVAAVIAAWAARYLELENEEEVQAAAVPALESGHVLVRERDQKFRQEIFTEKHQLVADEPQSLGGTDRGPNPYEYLLAGLGACTSMTIRMYARRKNIKLASVEVLLGHSRVHAEDCEDCESKQGFIDRIEKIITLKGDLDDTEKQRLLEIADRCPVHRTLHNEIQIISGLA